MIKRFRSERTEAGQPAYPPAGAMPPEDMKEEVTGPRYTIDETLAMLEKGISTEELVRVASCTRFEVTHFPLLLTAMDSKEDPRVLFGVTGFRKLLSRKEPPIQAVIDANALPRLLSYVTRGDFPRLQFEALWCLTNVASGNMDQVQVLVEKGAISMFIELLANTKSDEIVEQACWALGNVAGDNRNLRNMVLGAGAMRPLVRIL